MAEGVQIIWTPWRSQDELLQNRAWMYPRSAADGGVETSDMRRRACDQISAWKIRGNLPHAVESTWLLTEAILFDEVPADHMPIFAVKAAYITAISRFVTGLLDSQQESKYKISMYTIAQQIGLPALFVDLRHESTHGDMPSLGNLRGAAQRALRWLWDDYWSKLGGVGDARSKASLGDLIGDGVGYIDMEDQAKESMEGHKRGGWRKWEGPWIAKPIGASEGY